MDIHENIYYSKEYKMLYHFNETTLTEKEEKKLSNGYSLICKSGCGNSIVTLCSPSGEVILSYRMYDNDVLSFEDIISHSDGKEYYVYKENLYGYSVLSLEDKKQLHYIPRGKGGEVLGESPILLKMHYDKYSNIAAIDCCMWACPNETALIDFSEPLKEQKIILLLDLIDKDREAYNSIEFKAWDNGRLILKTDKNEELCFSAESLRKLIRSELK